MVGAILGLSPFMTRADAMRAMVRDREGAEREFTENVATEWGTANEAVARHEYEVETTHDVADAPFVPFEDWLGASPDGYVGKDGLVEFKCPYGIRNDPNPIFKSINEQPHYHAQVQIQLYVTGRKWCHFFQWTPHAAKYETVHIDRDWLDENLPRLRQFYAEFLAEPADDHLQPKRIEIDTPEAHRMIDEYDQLCEAIDNAEQRKKELLAQIVEKCGERNALFAGRKVTQVERAGSISYSKAIKHYAPDADLEPFRGKSTNYWQIK